MVDEPGKTIVLRYAGFWRRFLALIIDYVVISVALLPFVVMIGLVAPQYIVVSVPFGFFTIEKVIETETTEQKNSDGSTTAIDTNLIEVTTLGLWEYLYREKIEHGGEKDTTSRQLLDPTTKQELRVTTVGDIEIVVIFIYWILMEASRFQASIGKMALGIKVVDNKGQRLNIVRSLGRNALKVLSFLTMTIGFMMAGWTKKKQGLHDMIAGCYVTVQD